MVISSDRKLRPLLRALLLLGSLLGASTPQAEIYEQPADFLRKAFRGEPPPTAVVELNGAIARQAEKILGHGLQLQRIRYWQKGKLSAWILEEIGKTEPITFGVVIQDGRVRQTKILAFRESRGWEIRHHFYTRQYQGVGLTPDYRLDRSIDGITGATLSVNAMRKVVTLALYLATQIPQSE